MDTVTTPETRWLGRFVGVAALGLVGLAVALWMRYGTVVFAEMMMSAWSYCF